MVLVEDHLIKVARIFIDISVPLFLGDDSYKFNNGNYLHMGNLNTPNTNSKSEL